MLKSLHIKNLAIIDEVQLDFAPGFTVLTGETGAGKSILLDALGLVLGTRADPLLVRQGSEKAEISARFQLADAPAARRWLAANELIDDDEPDLCLIRRVVYAEGRARAFVNGQAVNAGPLRELGEELVSLYGQNESQTLLRPDVQRSLLDEFGGYPQVLSAVACAHAAHAETEAAMTLARANASRDPAAVELLRHQVNELLAANLQAGEAETLEAQHKRLANAGKLMEDGARATDLLMNGEGSIDEQLASACNLTGTLASTDPAFAEAESLVASAQAQVREAASLIQRQLDRLDLDPHTLEALERRLSALHDLARKHRTRLSLLPEHTQALQAELATLEQAGSQLDELAAERERRLATYRAAASRLTAARRQAAQKFAATIATEVRQLGMLNARFVVSVEDAAPDKVRAYGDDDIRFDFSANAGQEPRALAKVASGGELSRVSLAIQVALLTRAGAQGQSQVSPTMIFDEVDAGIGGGVAEIVGQKLKALGSGRQVFCVTHLPPVAAQGQQHFSISKAVVNGQTRTGVVLVTQAARADELARMLGGSELTEATRALASDLLRRASQ